jgi:hypothetical protein
VTSNRVDFPAIAAYGVLPVGFGHCDSNEELDTYKCLFFRSSVRDYSSPLETSHSDARAALSYEICGKADGLDAAWLSILQKQGETLL